MTTRSNAPVRRAAVCLVLAGAGLGVASGGGAWAATPVPCGTPAHPALYSTTHHEAVPAVTHLVKVIDTAAVPGRAATDEVSHVELTTVDGEGTPEGEGWRSSGRSWTIVDTPAYTSYGWLRTIIDRAAVAPVPAVPAVTHEEIVLDKAAWDETVIDSPAKPAVEEVSHFETVVDKAAWDETVIDAYAYQQKQTGNIRFEDSPTWNVEGGQGNLGWTRVPDQDKKHVVHHEAETHQVKVIDTPASPAVSEVSHVVHHEAVTRQVKVIDTPASPATAEVSHVVHHEAVTHTRTVVDVPEVPAVEAVEEISHDETARTLSADTPPVGEGWHLTDEELVPATTHLRHEWTRTVVDVPAVEAVPEVAEVSHLETVVDEAEVAAWDEQVLESEATPAGVACPTAVLGETAPVAGSAHPAASTHPTAVSAETLAQTGTDLAVPFGAGLAFVFVGGALVAAGRGRRD